MKFIRFKESTGDIGLFLANGTESAKDVILMRNTAISVAKPVHITRRAAGLESKIAIKT